MKLHDLLGKRFGRLVVTGRDYKTTHGLAHWQCLCDCGNTKVVPGRNLVNGTSHSCGCYRKEFIRANQKPQGESLLRRELSGYKRGALRRRLDWGLSFERFKELSLGVCFYCEEPSSKVLRRDKQELKCNGIDRLSNGLGYVEGNVVSCCSPCNYLKMDRDYEEFVDRVLKISRVLEKRGTQ